MGTYIFSSLAIRNLTEICEFIAQSDKKAASNLFDSIRQKSKLVASFPNMGKNYDWLSPNLRGFTVDDYIMFYYPREDGIEIIRAVYGKRDLQALFEEFGDEL